MKCIFIKRKYLIITIFLLALSLINTLSAHADGWKYYNTGDTEFATGSFQRRNGWHTAEFEFDTVQVFASLDNPKKTTITNPQPGEDYPLLVFTFAGAGYTPMEADFSYTTSKDIMLDNSLIGHVYTTYSNLGFTQIAKFDSPNAELVRTYENITIESSVSYYLQFGSVDLTKRPQITVRRTATLDGHEYTLYNAGTPYLHSDLSTYDMTGYVLGGPITWPSDGMYGLTRLTEPGIPNNGVYIKNSAAISGKKPKAPAGPVTVRYLDENQQPIHDEKKVYGLVGNPYDASTDEYKLTIDGYSLDESKLPANALGTFTSNGQIVTYNYTKNKAAAKDVTIRYVDQEGNQIHDPKTISGFVGDSYDASSDEYKLVIDGYTLDETKLPENISGALSDQDQTVTFVYAKNQVKAKDVTVRYVDQQGKQVHDPQTISGFVGDSYDASSNEYKLAIDGYALDETKLPENINGVLSNQDQTVTFVYTKNQVKAKDVTVRYVDQQGKQIRDPQTISGFVGNNYDASSEKYKLVISGYSLDEKKLPQNIKGTFSDKEQSVTFVYAKNQVKAKDITVHYVDSKGKQIHVPQTISGSIGDSYDASVDKYKLAITGYSLDEKKLPENIKGLFSDKEQSVTFVYKKIDDPVPAKKGTVIAQYIDETGTPLIPEEAQSGSLGEKYTTKAKSIDGYELIQSKLPENADGFFTEKPITVTYVYAKQQKPVITDKTTHTPTGKETLSTYSNTLLPKTGENKSIVLTLLGLVILIFAGVFIYRRKNNQ
ncbi:MucBP domain-containing protein [Enterococcus sp. AZ163]|uniref:MucBP domain-containing protein n=1 Tax=Enterococcus sp. AZ163 TaxID=2774638 RepID=UPI003D2DB55E